MTLSQNDYILIPRFIFPDKEGMQVEQHAETWERKGVQSKRSSSRKGQ